MNKNNISKSILSVTSPGTHLIPGDNDAAARCTRNANEELAAICKSHPDRFGFFASLPLPDVEASLNEIDYALDNLAAVGFALMTNAHGHYLGDATLEPVFAKLNTRKAIVFLHPTCSQHPNNPGSEKPLNQFPSPMLEFFFDTTRAVTNLILSDTVQRYTELTFVIPHGGAVLPSLLERTCAFAGIILGKGNATTSDLVKTLFATRFYFDLAGFVFPDLIHGLLRITLPLRLLYGSDYPWTPGPACEHLMSEMDKGLSEMCGSEAIQDIYRGNATRLLRQAS
jgi:predicted TIM-barrel fold metal-dependent hydrolase